jgi:histidine decarboxylase
MNNLCTVCLYFSFYNAETRKKNPNFGTSLLLANIVGQNPSSPKVVNGSFAAIFDSNDVLFEFAKQLCQMKLNIRDSPGDR